MRWLLPQIATNPAKVFSFRKFQELSVCRILFILLVSLAYDLMSVLPKKAAPSMLKCV